MCTLWHFRPTARVFVAWGSNGSVQFIDRRTGTVRNTFSEPPEHMVFSLVFSPDGAIVASGGRDGMVRWRKLAEGRERRGFRAGEADVRCLAIGGNGESIVAVAKDGEEGKDGYHTGLRVSHWSIALGRVEKSVFVVCGTPRPVALAPNGRMLAACPGDVAAVKLWDTSTGQQRGSLHGFTKGVTSLAFDMDGKVLATLEHGGQIRLWDVASENQLSSFSSSGGHIIFDLQFSPNAKVLAVGGHNGEPGGVYLYDVSSGRELAFIEIHELASPHHLAFSPDGKTLATANWNITIRDGHTPVTIKLWDVARFLER